MARNTIRFNSNTFRAILMSSGTRSAIGSVQSSVYGAAGFQPTVRTIAGNYGGGRLIGFVATHATTPEEATAQREALEAAVMGGA